MPQLKYCYKTRITFTKRVYDHHFLLRILPFENDAQCVVESQFNILPDSVIAQSVDTFGNKIITGYISSYHDYFEFLSEGIVETFDYKIQEGLNPFYSYPSKLTRPGREIEQLSSRLALTKEQSVHERIAIMSSGILEMIQYESGITGIQTTAEEALTLGKGVCQDYAQIMISLCRLNGIAARYVSGFIVGEGASHAWIEYYADGYWFAFDPTHNKKIETAYIKIAHGRDYDDCSIDKGVFRGTARQTLNVHLITEQQ